MAVRDGKEDDRCFDSGVLRGRSIGTVHSVKATSLELDDVTDFAFFEFRITDHGGLDLENLEKKID